MRQGRASIASGGSIKETSTRRTPKRNGGIGFVEAYIDQKCETKLTATWHIGARLQLAGSQALGLPICMGRDRGPPIQATSALRDRDVTKVLNHVVRK